MSSFDVEIDATEVFDELDRIRERVSSPSLRMFLQAKAHSWLVRRIDSRFSSEGDDASGKWAELAFATGRIRQYQGFAPFHPINRRTGKMQSFLRTSYRLASVGGGGARMTIPGSMGSADMASKIRTAQQGSTGGGSQRSQGPNRPAPARPVLAMDERDAEGITLSLAEWIMVGGGL